MGAEVAEQLGNLALQRVAPQPDLVETLLDARAARRGVEAGQREDARRAWKGSGRSPEYSWPAGSGCGDSSIATTSEAATT